MRVFSYSGDQLISKEYVIGDKLDKAIWIDVEDMQPHEEAALESFLKIDVPSAEEMREIELSHRLRTDNNAVLMTATLMAGISSVMQYDCTFIVIGSVLLTVRSGDSLPFRKLSKDIVQLQKNNRSSSDILTELLRYITDFTANIIEQCDKTIDDFICDTFGTNINKKSNTRTRLQHSKILEKIGVIGSMTSQVEESLTTLGRIIRYALQSRFFTQDTREQLNVLLRDLEALDEHIAHLSNKTNFLLEATLGIISLEQNNIIKVLSVAAVIFLPPTLVASIYGMNFEFIPALQWKLGYPAALLMMVLSAFLPYHYFKWRKWL